MACIISTLSFSKKQTSPDGNPLPDTKGSTFFTYDRIFDENSTTEEVYVGVARDIVHSVVRGLNGTIFAYGQTSSGKTFTMQGGDDHETPGIVQLAARDLFQQMEAAPDRMFLMRVSYLEIYQEDIKDLLNPEGSKLQVLCGIRLSYLQTFLRCSMDIGLKGDVFAETLNNTFQVHHPPKPEYSNVDRKSADTSRIFSPFI